MFFSTFSNRSSTALVIWCMDTPSWKPYWLYGQELVHCKDCLWGRSLTAVWLGTPRCWNHVGCPPKMSLYRISFLFPFSCAISRPTEIMMRAFRMFIMFSGFSSCGKIWTTPTFTWWEVVTNEIILFLADCLTKSNRSLINFYTGLHLFLIVQGPWKTSVT